MNYKDQVVWITGASSGIGEALTHALYQKGAKLILSARRTDELERVKRECTGTLHAASDCEDGVAGVVPSANDTVSAKAANSENNAVSAKAAASENDTVPAEVAAPETSPRRSEDRIVILPLDLSEPERFSQKTEEAIAAFGHVDMLINNGGMGQRAKAVEAQMKTIRRVMEVNFFGTVGLTQAVAPHMIERGDGHIVVVSSVMGKIGTAWRSTYAASKHALHGFFDSMRHEVEGQGLKVTLVCPGFVSTDITKHALLADGSTFGKVGRGQMHGMPADVFAEKMLSKLGHGKKEIFIGGKEVYAVYLKRISLNLLDFVLKRADIK